MIKNASCDAEITIYRFILGIALGMYIGSRTIPQSINHVLCMRSPAVATFMQEATTLENDKPQIENLSSGMVYIGMMSMDNKMDSRVDAAVNTWIKALPPNIKVEIFANNNGSIDPDYGYREAYLSNGVRVLQLPGVSDHVYPPQKKSFSMVKFMHDMYIDKFDWFVRLDDDAYVNTDKLLKVLGRINASKPIYMGHAGYGKDADDYIDISKGENYCMGGPGMVFSKGLLRQFAPQLKNCLANLITEHEDIELGRCVQKTTGVACTTSWESIGLFFQNFQHGTYAHNVEKPIEKDLDKGMIFHANKLSQYQHNFHVKLLHLKIKRLISKVTDLEREIRNSFGHEDQIRWGGNSYAHLRWTSINLMNSYSSNEREMKQKMHVNLLNRLLTNTNTYVKSVPKTNKQRRRLAKAYLELTYHVVNPLLATDAISQIKLQYGTGRTASKTNRYIHQRQYFSQHLLFFRETHEIEVPALKDKLQRNLLTDGQPFSLTATDQTPINFLMALSGRPENFIRFLQNFDDSFLSKNENVNLIIAFFPKPEDFDYTQTKSENEVVVKSESEQQYNDDDTEYLSQTTKDLDFIQENIRLLQSQYPDRLLKLVLLKKGANFSRGVGLQEASKHVINSDEIIFFCDVDLVFTSDILTHIRRNTLEGHRVYYPVFFSQYDPDVVYVEKQRPPTHFSFEELDGFWRYFSYGMLSIYKSDFDKTTGFNTNIQGWGLEDVEMVSAILKTYLDIFQCPDPAEVHVYHDKYCDPSTTAKQYNNCMNSRAVHYGPKTLLYYLFYATENNDNFLQDKTLE